MFDFTSDKPWAFLGYVICAAAVAFVIAAGLCAATNSGKPDYCYMRDDGDRIVLWAHRPWATNTVVFQLGSGADHGQAGKSVVEMAKALECPLH